MNCLECSNFIAEDGKRTGRCVKLGDADLVKDNSTIIDFSEKDLYPYNIEVGENFGCIHFDLK